MEVGVENRSVQVHFPKELGADLEKTIEANLIQPLVCVRDA